MLVPFSAEQSAPSVLRPLLNTNIDHGRTPQISLSIERTTEVSQRPDPIRKQGTQSMRDEVIGQHVDVPAAASDPTVCIGGSLT
jgi:hypothetical protein